MKGTQHALLLQGLLQSNVLLVMLIEHGTQKTPFGPPGTFEGQSVHVLIETPYILKLALSLGTQGIVGPTGKVTAQKIETEAVLPPKTVAHSTAQRIALLGGFGQTGLSTLRSEERRVGKECRCRGGRV